MNISALDTICQDITTSNEMSEITFALEFLSSEDSLLRDVFAASS